LHFDELKRRIAKNAGMDGIYLGDEMLQDAVIEADARDALKKYDWLLFDEAQDFVNTANWEALRCLLKGGSEKEKYILAFDGKAQSAVYNNFDEMFFNLVRNTCDFPLQLRRNYRNPNNIARKAALLIGEEEEKIEVGREFLALPKLRVVERDKLSIFSKITSDIKQLTASGVDESDITVLTFKKREDSVLFGVKDLQGRKLKDVKRELNSEGALLDMVTWSTVSSFKGLENHYIFLIEGENFNRNGDWWRSQLYVALTRAKTEFRYYGRVDDECWKELTNA
jgi:superfamily I DNA/RNA helicase